MKENIKKVIIKSVGKKMAGILYLPEGFDENEKYKAIVFTPPYNQVKEQTAAVYGQAFAKKGYVTLVFDFRSKGESEPADKFMNDDNLFNKQEDTRNAISYMKTLSFVDDAELFGVGACLGAGIMASVVVTDLRLKAFGTISGMLQTNIVQWRFKKKSKIREEIITANAARQKMYETGKPVYAPVGDHYESFDPTGKPIPVQQGWEYYMRTHGQKQYKNYSPNSLGNIDESWMFNTFEQYKKYIMIPFIGVVGQKAKTKIITWLFYRGIKTKKKYVKIKGASHVDMYYKVDKVEQAVEKIDSFFMGL